MDHAGYDSLLARLIRHHAASQCLVLREQTVFGWRLIAELLRRRRHDTPAPQQHLSVVVTYAAAGHRGGAPASQESQVELGGDVGEVAAHGHDAQLRGTCHIADLDHAAALVEEVLGGSAEPGLASAFAAAIARWAGGRLDNDGRGQARQG